MDQHEAKAVLKGRAHCPMCLGDRVSEAIVTVLEYTAGLEDEVEFLRKKLGITTEIPAACQAQEYRA